MTDDAPSLSQTRSHGIVVLAAAAAAGLLIALTGALWAHYGTAVFYEIILAGFNACF